MHFCANSYIHTDGYCNDLHCECLGRSTYGCHGTSYGAMGPLMVAMGPLMVAMGPLMIYLVSLSSPKFPSLLSLGAVVVSTTTTGRPTPLMVCTRSTTGPLATTSDGMLTSSTEVGVS